jgi:tetrahydromethanopterin S-methyltransferase subunit F
MSRLRTAGKVAGAILAGVLVGALLTWAIIEGHAGMILGV